MEKSKKILILVGIGLLAAVGIYVGIKYSNKKKELDNANKEEVEPKLEIDAVLDSMNGDGTVSVQYTFGEKIGSYNTFGREQNIQPKKGSAYTLQINTETDPDVTIFFNLFKDGKFLKTLKQI